MIYTLRDLRASPWTLAGLLLAWLTRCEMRAHVVGWRTYTGRSWPWRLFTRLTGMEGLTLGSVTIFTVEDPPEAMRRHELAHVEQARRLGIWYVPAYLWGCVTGLMRAIHAHHPMEVEAREVEDA